MYSCFRLHDYDAIFGPVVNEPETCFQIEIPAIQNFKDVNSHTILAPLTSEGLEVFCTLAEREDISTGQNMYAEGFLLTARAANTDSNFYILATCASEMRKQITYKIIVKYDEDTIKETQCECAAGSGPYAQCKHVIMVLYAIIDFTKTKIIKTRPSCTSNLQNFHQPTKFYTGNPVEAQNLILKSNNKVLKEIPSWDPRPSTSLPTQKIKENILNEIANFCASHKKTMPIAQLIEAANTKNDKKKWKRERLLLLQK